MKNLKLFLFVSIVLLTSCSVRTTVNLPEESKMANQEDKRPTNIILMVGDGMGLTQTTAGYINNDMRLNLERVPVIGLSKTWSSAQIITDSAAGATAFSIGEKTYNGAIGVDKDTIAQETILETLAKKGYATGLVATCAITHATPASFYAHQPSRKMGYEIAADMVDSPLDLFVGGGKSHFENRTSEKEGETDDRNIINELTAEGFTFVNSLSELETTKGRVGYFIADKHPESIINGRGSILPNSVEPVINHLKGESDKGFFLMIEGSQIDWGGHANDSEYIITEMIDFDQAVGKVLDFAERDGNTLVIITADHETGGYALSGGGEKHKNYAELEPDFSTGGHTATMVPVYAYGPKAELFQGMYDNNEIYHKMRLALGR